MKKSRKQAKPASSQTAAAPATAPNLALAASKPELERRAAPNPTSIEVRGARVHNLQNIDVDIPRDQLIVLTGVSGSGKSTLAFDTIHAEGQRRFIECLSSYARQFLDQLERPEVDSIEGLPPTVAIDQRAGIANPRSTLGTITEVYDYVRLLFARLGIPHCPACGTAIRNQTPEQMTAQLLALPDGRRIQILAPLVRSRKGQHLEVFQAIRRAGLIRARVDGELVEISDDPPKLSKTKQHSIEAVIDRIAIRDGIRPRLAESIDLALKLSAGTILVLIETVAKTWDERLLSINLSCPDCGNSLPEIEPRSFSFNSPYGACPECDGLGSRRLFRAHLVMPDPSLAWNTGAVVALDSIVSSAKASAEGLSQIDHFLNRRCIDRAAPLQSWPVATIEALWNGEPESAFGGLSAFLDQVIADPKNSALARVLDIYREEVPCPACAGSRLRPEARAVRVDGRTIAEVTSMPVGDLLRIASAYTFEPTLEAVAKPLMTEIVGRLKYLNDVGLGYLTLGRSTDTLSGGELQRARLAAQLGSGLVGVCYILDEPTAGLHPSDTDRLLASLRALIALGNSVLVVEHDEALIRAADWVIDIGPGAGPDGGSIVAQGPPADLARFEPLSATAVYLNRSRVSLGHARDRPERSPGSIEIENAAIHNLKAVNARIPLAAFTCVSGVSGSGKSSLIRDILATTLKRDLQSRPFHRAVPPSMALGPGGATIAGLGVIEQLIEVDQSPIGRTPRSTPATATGLFDEIRRVFALTREAKIRGFGAARFSFNARGGRCEVCQGLGRRRVAMHFLPDLYVTCEECNGTRYNRPTLEVRFKGKSIGDVLQMRVDECRTVFDAIPRVLRGLNALHDVGLGYVTLGQSSTTLSGGEAQRIKLASELGRNAFGHALYILDEPTTGLHFADIERLLEILHRLVDMGHSVVVIEHNLDVIASADWLIDLGPDAGADGGSIVAMGPPSVVVSSLSSRTAAALRRVR